MTSTQNGNAWIVLISSKEPGVNALVERLREHGLYAERRAIEVADIAFELHGRTYLLAEMKTLRDALASIGDGRYKAQAAAMTESGVPHLFYLVRGIKTPGVISDEQLKLQHSMTRIQLTGTVDNKHISVIYLSHEDSVFHWIKYVYSKLSERSFDASDSKGSLVAPFSNDVKHTYGSKPATRSQQQVFAEQLSRLTGIGIDKAKQLATLYPSFLKLAEFLKGQPDQKALIAALKATRLGLGESAAMYIWTQLLSEDERPWQWAAKKGKSQCASLTPPKKRTKKGVEADGLNLETICVDACARYLSKDTVLSAASVCVEGVTDGFVRV